MAVTGNYYALKGQHERAILYFRRALALNPAYLSAYTLMGHEYIELHNEAAAITAYRRAVDISPRDFRAWYGLGQAYELLGMSGSSVYYYRQACVLRPFDARMWCAQGNGYEKMGKEEEAVRCYERAMGEEDREGVAVSRLARLWARRGEGAKAAQYWRLVLKKQDDLERGADGRCGRGRRRRCGRCGCGRGGCGCGPRQYECGGDGRGGVPRRVAQGAGRVEGRRALRAAHDGRGRCAQGSGEEHAHRAQEHAARQAAAPHTAAVERLPTTRRAPHPAQEQRTREDAVTAQRKSPRCCRRGAIEVCSGKLFLFTVHPTIMRYSKFDRVRPVRGAQSAREVRYSQEEPQNAGMWPIDSNRVDALTGMRDMRRPAAGARTDVRERRSMTAAAVSSVDACKREAEDTSTRVLQ